MSEFVEHIYQAKMCACDVKIFRYKINRYLMDKRAFRYKMLPIMIKIICLISSRLEARAGLAFGPK